MHNVARIRGGYMKRAITLIAVPLLSMCVSASPEGQKVRVTNNPDVVRDCKFLGNVKAMSGWGGDPDMKGVGMNNIEETLRDRAAKLGANAVYVISNSGSRGNGEAYLCTAETVSNPPKQ